MDDADIKDAMRWCKGTGKWAGREEQFLQFVVTIQVRLLHVLSKRNGTNVVWLIHDA